MIMKKYLTVCMLILATSFTGQKITPSNHNAKLIEKLNEFIDAYVVDTDIFIKTIETMPLTIRNGIYIAQDDVDVLLENSTSEMEKAILEGRFSWENIVWKTLDFKNARQEIKKRITWLLSNFDPNEGLLSEKGANTREEKVKQIERIELLLAFQNTKKKEDALPSKDRSTLTIKPVTTEDLFDHISHLKKKGTGGSSSTKLFLGGMAALAIGSAIGTATYKTYQYMTTAKKGTSTRTPN